MTLQNIQQIPTKEKKFMVNEICMMYRKLRTTNNSLQLSDSAAKLSAINEKTVSMFDTIIALLPKDQQTIIEAEFLNGVKLRWQDYQ